MANLMQQAKTFGMVHFFMRLSLMMFFPWGIELSGAEIIRGPYLQTATPTNMTVRWRTDSRVTGWLAYGTNPINLDRTISGTNFTSDHLEVMQGLEADTQYYYAVGELDEVKIWGPEYTFRTAPEPGSTGPVRIWAIGDSGTASVGNLGSHWVRDAYYNQGGIEDTDVWLMLGDNAYSTGTDEEYQVAVFDTYPELLRRVPVWSTLGNHETYSEDFDGSFAYLDIFSPPRNGEAGGVASGSPRYYAFDHANIHFVCLDSETSSRSATGPMMTWLRQDLEQNTNDWLIAFWHTPPYSKGSHDSDFELGLIGMRTEVVPLLESFGVDLVLSGHSHNYERSYFLNGHYGTSATLEPTMIIDRGSGRTNETGAYVKSEVGPVANLGTVYVVAGSSGWATFITGRHPAMYAQHLQIGSLVLDVHGQRLDGRFLRDTGEYADHFTILKGASAKPFKLVVFQLEDGNGVLWWNSVLGHRYIVEHTTSLVMEDWAGVSDEILATGVSTSWTNPVPNLETQGFYRVLDLGK